MKKRQEGHDEAKNAFDEKVAEQLQAQKDQAIADGEDPPDDDDKPEFDSEDWFANFDDENPPFDIPDEVFDDVDNDFNIVIEESNIE